MIHADQIHDAGLIAGDVLTLLFAVLVGLVVVGLIAFLTLAALKAWPTYRAEFADAIAKVRGPK